MTYVYFIEAEDGFIKVGWSAQPLVRLKALQGAHARPLKLLACMRGGPPEEAALHKLFRNTRAMGEWFQGDAIRLWLQRNVGLLLPEIEVASLPREHQPKPRKKRPKRESAKRWRASWGSSWPRHW